MIPTPSGRNFLHPPDYQPLPLNGTNKKENCREKIFPVNTHSSGGFEPSSTAYRWTFEERSVASCVPVGDFLAVYGHDAALPAFKGPLQARLRVRLCRSRHQSNQSSIMPLSADITEEEEEEVEEKKKKKKKITASTETNQ